MEELASSVCSSCGQRSSYVNVIRCLCGHADALYCSTACRTAHWGVHRFLCSWHQQGQIYHSLSSTDEIDAIEEEPLEKAIGGKQQDPSTRDSLRITASSVDNSDGSLPQPPLYLLAAEKIVKVMKDVPSGANLYHGPPSYVKLRGHAPRARTQCATFLRFLWKYAYQLRSDDLHSWLHRRMVFANDYFREIECENGFQSIRCVDEIQPGDIMAMQYEPSANNTGHVMVIRGKPVQHAATMPVIDGTVQWAMEVIDSTGTPHGQQDTRHGSSGGIGIGTMRLYSTAVPTNSSNGNVCGGEKHRGIIQGYTWSLWKNSIYYGRESPRRFVMGRPVHFLGIGMDGAKDNGTQSPRTLLLEEPDVNPVSNDNASLESASNADTLSCDSEDEDLFNEESALSLFDFMDYDLASSVFHQLAKIGPKIKSNEEKFVYFCAASECYRRAEDGPHAALCARKALHCCADQPIRCGSFGQLKLGQALMLCQDYWNAIEAFRQGLFLLSSATDSKQKEEEKGKEGDEEVEKFAMFCDSLHRLLHVELQTALRLHKPSVILRQTQSHGLGLFSAQSISVGTEILSEDPILIWENIPSTFVNPKLVERFVQLNVMQRQLILSMHCPPQVPADLLKMKVIAQEFQENEARRETEKEHEAVDESGDGVSSHKERLPSISTQELMRLAVIAKCNAHTLDYPEDDGTLHTATKGASSSSPADSSGTVKENKYCCFYDLMTKASHSCSPNMMYDGRNEMRCYVAIRNIASGTELSFSYFGRQWMFLSTVRRQEQLYQNFLFHCECERCQGPDLSRGIPCCMPRCYEGTRLRRASGEWFCDVCGEEWASHEEMGMALFKKEHEIEEKVLAMDEILVVRAEIKKNQYEELKGIMSLVLEHLGTRHWTMLLTCRVFALYFALVAMKTSATSRVIALQISAKWIHKMLRAASSQACSICCPFAVCEILFEFSQRYFSKVPELHTVRLKLLKLIYPYYHSVLPQSGETIEIQRVLSQSKLITISTTSRGGEGEKIQHAGKNSLGGDMDTEETMDSDWSLLPEIEVDEAISDVYATWENHLADRVANAVRSQANPNLPSNLLAAFGK